MAFAHPAINLFLLRGTRRSECGEDRTCKLLVHQQLAMFGRSREDLTFFHVVLQQNRTSTASHVLCSRVIV